MLDDNDIFQNPDELGIDPYTVTGDLPIEAPQTEIVKVEELSEIDIAKANLLQITEIGNKSLKQLYNLAIATDDPRVYRALSELMGTVAGANREIIELYKVKNDASRAAGPAQNVTNNTLFVGSSAELNKFISEMKRNNDPPELEAYIDD